MWHYKQGWLVTYLEWFYDEHGYNDRDEQGCQPLEGDSGAKVVAVEHDQRHRQQAQQHTQRVGQVAAPRGQGASGRPVAGRGGRHAGHGSDHTWTDRKYRERSTPDSHGKCWDFKLLALVSNVFFLICSP